MRTVLLLLGGVLTWHLVDQVGNPIVTLAALAAVGVVLLRTHKKVQRHRRHHRRRRHSPAGGA